MLDGMPGPRPLPPREGIDAIRFRLPDPPERRSVRSELFAAFPDHHEEIAAQLDAGGVVDRYGQPVGEYARAVKNVDVWLYISPPEEPEVPEDIEIVYLDEALAVIDKPHFLATTPRAAHIRQTALVKARVATGHPHLAPAHRLDRGTAGLLVMAVTPAARAPLATQFERRNVIKKYLAVTHLPDGEIPGLGQVDGLAGVPEVFERASRIRKIRGVLQGSEIAGAANAVTRGRLLDRADGPDGPLGLWLLEPRTGQTHQLRIHLAALGCPIVDDDLYPQQKTWDAEDFSRPLQLLAAGMQCAHPVSGQRMQFTSPRALARWPRPWPQEEIDEHMWARTLWP